MDATQWYRELVTDPAAQRTRLDKPNVVGVRRRSATDQAWLPGRTSDAPYRAGEPFCPTHQPRLCEAFYRTPLKFSGQRAHQAERRASRVGRRQHRMARWGLGHCRLSRVLPETVPRQFGHQRLLACSCAQAAGRIDGSYLLDQALPKDRQFIVRENKFCGTHRGLLAIPRRPLGSRSLAFRLAAVIGSRRQLDACFGY